MASPPKPLCWPSMAPGVSLHGVDHVTAFAVDSMMHKGALLPGRRDRLRQFRQAWRPKALEESRLRLDHGDPIAGRLHHNATKSM